uniref:Trafficking protein particle complex subunit 12 n=1 Tax=Panagrolaimus superbus TaxID=310955 RepID=A0A914YP16_9BILA
MSQPSWSEVEYLYYWPENERLQIVVAAQRYETVYTMPGLKNVESLTDKMAYATLKLKEVQIQRPTVAESVEGLKQLIGLGHLRAAYNLTITLLNNYGQGVGKAGQPTRNTFETFEFWSCRFQLMMALKLHSELLEELAAFETLDAPDTYFQYYPALLQQGYIGSIIPFNLRMIHAEAPRFSPDPIESIKRCCALEEITKQVIDQMTIESRSENQIKLWKQRLEAVKLMKARCWYTMKEFHQCITVYQELLSKATDDKRARLLQLLLRISVVIGDEKLVEKFSREITVQNSGSQNFYLHKGIKDSFYGNYAKAINNFQNAQKTSGGLSNPTVVNNEAICQLYNGKVEDARSHLLSFSAVPTEPIMLNVNTISQLISTSKDNAKQQFLLNIVNK